MATFGHFVSPETKKKIGDANRGRVHSKEYREAARRRQTGVKRSEETKRKISDSHKGSKNWAWKGGITKESHRLRNSREYRIWREAVLIRDGHKCIWCGSPERLEADHIKPFALFPELRFAIDNGRTLCRPCHQTTFEGSPRKLTQSL